MSHPSLGMPPRDLTAGDRAAATAIQSAGPRLSARALAAALDIDPTMKDRHEEVVRQALLADLQAYVDRLVIAVSSGDASSMAHFAELIAPRYRKRKIAMDDAVTLCEGVRRAAGSVIDPSAQPLVDAAIDQAIAVLKWHRRLAGDARKRNPLLAFIYRGA